MEKHFYCVHDWMTNELGLRGSERDVFAVIFSFSESCGVFTGGLKYLCQRTGTTKPTVMGCLGKLLKKDLLIKKERLENGVKLCEYRINQPRITALVPGFEALQEGDKKLSRPVQETLTAPGKNLTRPGQEILTGEGKKLECPGQEILPNNKEYNKDHNKEDNKENVSLPPKSPTRKYGEYHNVLLTEEEFSKLKREFPEDWQQRIERLSAYMASTGKRYKNHLATIRSWAMRDEKKKPEESPFAFLTGGLSL